MSEPDVAPGRGARAVRAAGLLVALGICGVAIMDPDLPWHLAAARHLVETRAFPHQDFLSWTRAGRPWIDFEWGSELIFYGVLRAGGPAALWTLRAGALFGLILMVLGLLRLWKIPKSWDGFAAPALAAALCPIFGVRPEIFSLIFLVLEFQILERRRLGQLRVGAPVFVAAHVILYAVWANLHAGFAAALLLCFCYGLGELREQPDGTIPLSLVAGVAGLLGTLINPYGGAIYAVLLDHWRHRAMLGRLIEEWKTPYITRDYMAGYWVLVIFALAGLAADCLQGGELPFAHLCAVLVFGFLGARAVRSTAYSLVVVFPLGLPSWRRLCAAEPRRRALAAFAAAAVVLVLWREHFWAGSQAFFGWPATVDTQESAGAFAFLRREKPILSGLKLYNPYNWGGNVDYDLYPEYKAFIDGRYIFLDLLDLVDRAIHGLDDWQKFMSDAGVGLAVVQNDGIAMQYPWDVVPRPHSVYTWPKRNWALVYFDSGALVFVRRSLVPQRWLDAHEYRWIAPHDQHHLGLVVVGRGATLKTVEDELARYRREVGDPAVVAEFDEWLVGFKKGVTSSPRR